VSRVAYIGWAFGFAFIAAVSYMLGDTQANEEIASSWSDARAYEVVTIVCVVLAVACVMLAVWRCR
jgi:type IV secretory pathway TrbF-like protein